MREEQANLTGLSLLCFGQRNTGKSERNTGESGINTLIMLRAVDCVIELWGLQSITPIKPIQYNNENPTAIAPA
jgi:hypothetical protein